MRVSVVQVDGKMPNLALMKLATYHRNQGDEVRLGLDGGADIAYISVIWPQNRPDALGIATTFPDAEVHIGGSGFNYSTVLPDEIEHTMPAYDLWGVDYSMGFTSRGCIRNCPWCIVPHKEGWIRAHAPLSEFLHPSHDRVIILDGNLLASPNSVETLTDLRDRRIKVSLNQGLDIRLVDNKKAALLSDIRYYNYHFTSKQIYFAFDEPKIAKAVRRGVKTLADHGIPFRDMMFYVLVGYNTTFQQDMARYRILWEELGVYPYIMIYNKSKKSPTILGKFQRWVNTRLHKVIPWEEYDRLTPEEVEMFASKLTEPVEVVP